MKVAKNDGGAERLGVAKLVDRLILIEPHATGSTVTRFSNGEPSTWVDAHCWFVDKAGAPTPIGEDGGNAVRFWSEVLVPELKSSIGERLAARIVRPGAAYVFDDLDDDELVRCEKADAMLTSGEDVF